MKLQKIEKLYTGSHTNLYDLVYRNKGNKEKHYSIISRNKDLTPENILNEKPSNGVVICAITQDNSKMLILNEFRMSVNRNIINFPSGLVDPGESIEDAARRELLEETGHDIVSIKKVLKPSYSAIGITDEKITVVVCYITNEPVKKQNMSDNEQLSLKLVDKNQMTNLLEAHEFSSRTQLLAAAWFDNLL